MRSRDEGLWAEELREDFPRYAAACLKIATKKGRLETFLLNPAQCKVEAAIEDSRRAGRPCFVVELKARQVGLSTHAEGRLFHGCHLNDHFTGLVIAHEKDSATNIFRMSRRFYKNLPASVKPETPYFTKNAIEFKNGSRLEVDVASVGGGRSYTAHRIHLSEYAFYADPEAVLDGVLQAAAEIPETLVIVESTPRGMNAFYDLYVNAKAGRNDFVPIFIPWFEDSAYRMPANFGAADLDEEERSLRERFGLTLDQLAWRRWCIRNKCRGSLTTFNTEYPADDHTCFLLSGHRIFDPKALEHYARLVPPHVDPATLPKPCEIDWDEDRKQPVLREHPHGRLVIYRPPEPRHLYIAGVDPSEGAEGSANSPVVVTDRMTLEPVAVWCGRQRPDRLAHTARSLCVYYNGAQCIWEANNHGLAFQIEFEKLYDFFYYRDVSPDSVERKAGSKPGYDNKPGKSRHLLFNTGRQLINEMLAPIRDPNIVGELPGFFYDDRGDVKAEKGRPTDCAVAYFLTLLCHRGSDEVALEPLAEESLSQILEHVRYRETARSMGQEADLSEVFARFHLTAQEIEALDELEDQLEERERRTGFPAAS